MANKYHSAFQGFVKLFTGAAKAGEKSNPTTIIGVAPSKNLAKRRADQDSIVAGVDKHLKSSDTASSKIKKKFTKQASSIHDKYEKKADGGRMGYKVGGRIGLKHGSYETVPPSKGFSEYVTKEKQRKIDAENKKANEKDKSQGPGPMGRAGGRKAVKVGGRMGYKDGTKGGRKMGGGSNMSNTSVKKKFKNLGNLPETIQIKIAGKKIAKKV